MNSLDNAPAEEVKVLGYISPEDQVKAMEAVKGICPFEFTCECGTEFICETCYEERNERPKNHTCFVEHERLYGDFQHYCKSCAIKQLRARLLKTVEMDSCKDDPQSWSSNMHYVDYKELCKKIYPNRSNCDPCDDIYCIKVKTKDGKYITRPGFPLDPDDTLGHVVKCTGCCDQFYICMTNCGEMIQCPECREWCHAS